MRLYHVSEDPDILVFHPRLPKRDDLDPATGLVWALDEERLPNFLTPRDCPRVAYHVGSRTSAGDRERFSLPAGHGMRWLSSRSGLTPCGIPVSICMYSMETALSCRTVSPVTMFQNARRYPLPDRRWTTSSVLCSSVTWSSGWSRTCGISPTGYGVPP